MNHILTIIFHFSFLLNGFVLFAQGPENLLIHRDRAFYVTGETIWYKACFPGASVKSQILHVEIIHPDGSSVFHQKLAIEKNQAWGDITIPYDWPTAMYTLRAYTLWNLNFPEEYITQLELPIYSYVEESPKSYLKGEKSTISFNDNINLDIKLNPQSPSRREVSTLLLNITDKSGKPVEADVSVSIVDAQFNRGNPSVAIQSRRLKNLPSPEKGSDQFTTPEKTAAQGPGLGRKQQYTASI
jgi:hypothetical protein